MSPNLSFICVLVPCLETPYRYARSEAKSVSSWYLVDQLIPKVLTLLHSLTYSRINVCNISSSFLCSFSFLSCPLGVIHFCDENWESLLPRQYFSHRTFYAHSKILHTFYTRYCIWKEHIGCKGAVDSFMGVARIKETLPIRNIIKSTREYLYWTNA